MCALQRLKHVRLLRAWCGRAGFSGPAVLDLSHWAVRALEKQQSNFSLYVAWSRIDRSEWFQLLTVPANKSARVAKVLHQGQGPSASQRGLPERLVKALCAEVGIWADMKCGDLAKPFRERLLDALVHFELPVDGHLGCALHTYIHTYIAGGGCTMLVTCGQGRCLRAKC